MKVLKNQIEDSETSYGLVKGRSWYCTKARIGGGIREVQCQWKQLTHDGLKWWVLEVQRINYCEMCYRQISCLLKKGEARNQTWSKQSKTSLPSDFHYKTGRIILPYCTIFLLPLNSFSKFTFFPSWKNIIDPSLR
jgi:hypothetical protein